MSLRSPHRKRFRLQPGINLTPLLDVIFNLLFFFILATTIRTEEEQMEVRLPASESSVETPRERDVPVVTIDRQGQIHFKGRRVVESELQLELNYLARRGVTRVYVRGDREADWGRIVGLMDLCRQAGITNVLADTQRPPSSLEGRR